MLTTLHWLNSALASKDIGAAMTYYRIQNQQISATDGRLTASHPWPHVGDYLVPGAEMEKVLKRMPSSPSISIQDNSIKLKAGRFQGTIQTLPLQDWSYPGIDDVSWRPIPPTLPSLLKALRPFLSENATQGWAQCIALQSGWCLATNNIAVAGAECEGLGDVKALLPPWTVDFLLGRLDGLKEWAWSDNFVAFRWESGAWMRSQLIVGSFPEKAAELIKQAVGEKPTQQITEDFRAAFRNIGEMAEDTLLIYKDCIRSRFGKAIVEEGIESEVPEGQKASVWGAKYLLPVIMAADRWSPSKWPAPAPWRGEELVGWIVGRKV